MWAPPLCLSCHVWWASTSIASITITLSGPWCASREPSPPTNTGMNSFPGPPSAWPMIGCSPIGPSEPTRSMFASCTWLLRPANPRWKRRCACCWKPGHCRPYSPCVTWCICPQCHLSHNCTPQPSISPPTINSYHQGGSMANQVNRHDELRALLERLNLGAMAAVFADLALKAAKENISHEAYLFELGKHEEELRTQRRTARLLRASALPADKTFRTLNLGKLSPQLQLQIERLKSGSFLESATNVVAVGRPGVGKSHCAAAVGYELILQGHPVLWTPTSNLVQRLLAAKRDLKLPQELAKLDKFGSQQSLHQVARRCPQDGMPLQNQFIAHRCRAMTFPNARPPNGDHVGSAL